MNRSYSKIRHIKETNQRLENRLLNEQDSLNGFIPYEQALALKELGFDEPCFAYYDEDIYLFTVREQDDIYDYWTPAPTYQHAFRWFRKKYGLFHSIERESAQDYFCNYSIKEFDGIKDIDHRGNGYKYEEEAELACLKKLIEIVKQK